MNDWIKDLCEAADEYDRRIFLHAAFKDGAEWAVEWFRAHYNFSVEIKSLTAHETGDKMKKEKPNGIESKGISASEVYAGIPSDFFDKVNDGLFNMGKPPNKKRKKKQA